MKKIIIASIAVLLVVVLAVAICFKSCSTNVNEEDTTTQLKVMTQDEKNDIVATATMFNEMLEKMAAQSKREKMKAFFSGEKVTYDINSDQSVYNALLFMEQWYEVRLGLQIEDDLTLTERAQQLRNSWELVGDYHHIVDYDTPINPSGGTGEGNSGGSGNGNSSGGNKKTSTTTKTNTNTTKLNTTKPNGNGGNGKVDVNVNVTWPNINITWPNITLPNIPDVTDPAPKPTNPDPDPQPGYEVPTGGYTDPDPQPGYEVPTGGYTDPDPAPGGGSDSGDPDPAPGSGYHVER